MTFLSFLRPPPRAVQECPTRLIIDLWSSETKGTAGSSEALLRVHYKAFFPSNSLLSCVDV